MADPGYLRSTDGSDADTGATWALANATIVGAVADCLAGDTIYISQSHSETAALIDVTFPGTLAEPNRVICANDAAAPPTSVASGATFALSNGQSDWTGSFYLRGCTFNITGGTTASIQLISAGNHRQIFEDCIFNWTGNTNTATRLLLGPGNQTNPSEITFVDCDVGFGNSVQFIQISGARFHWKGGAWLSGGTSPASVFVYGVTDRAGPVLVEGVDFTNLASTSNLVSPNVDVHGRVLFRNCKLPSGWGTGGGGKLVGSPGVSVAGFRVEMHNCDNADTNYRLWTEDYAGSVKSETVNIRTGSASAVSWKMESYATALYPDVELSSPELSRYNTAVASPITVSISILHDSATALTTKEVWLEVQYLGTSGFPLTLFKSNDARGANSGNILAAAANHPGDASATWTTTGLTTPTKHLLSVTFTAQEVGFIHAVVHLAKASKIIYVDPDLHIS